MPGSGHVPRQATPGVRAVPAQSSRLWQGSLRRRNGWTTSSTSGQRALAAGRQFRNNATTAQGNEGGDMRGFTVAVVGCALAATTLTSLGVVTTSAASAAQHAKAHSQTTCTPTTKPKITSVSKVLAQQTQTVTIKGTCLGAGTAFTAADSEWFQVIDKSTTPGWSGCHVSSLPEDDSVTCSVSKWTNTKVVFKGFTGPYGTNNWTVNPGDKIEFLVYNLNSDGTSYSTAGKKTVKAVS